MYTYGPHMDIHLPESMCPLALGCAIQGAVGCFAPPSVRLPFGPLLTLSFTLSNPTVGCGDDNVVKASYSLNVVEVLLYAHPKGREVGKNS